MARRRRHSTNGVILQPGDAEYDALLEQADTEVWVEAGAPTPMAMWQQLQRERGEETARTSDLPEWLTTEEVAQHFGWSAKTVRADIRAGRLLATERRPYKVRRADAEAWAVARRAPTAKPPKQPKRRTASQPSERTFRELARKKS